LIGALVLSVPLLAQPVNLRPGKYEFKTYMRMPGMPPNLPPRIDMTCVTPEQVTDVSKVVHARDALLTNECKTSDSKVGGNTLTFTMTCPKLTTTNEYTFNGESFSAVSWNKGAAKDDWMMKVDAKRGGECDK
jgi:hypothetical protein